MKKLITLMQMLLPVSLMAGGMSAPSGNEVLVIFGLFAVLAIAVILVPKAIQQISLKFKNKV